MNYRLALCALSAAGLLGATTVWGASKPGTGDMTISVLQGDVTQKVSMDDAWKPAGHSAPATGTAVKTGSGAEAVLSLPGNVSLRLSPDTKVEVVSVLGGRVSVKIDSGRAFASIAGQADDCLSMVGPDSTVTAQSGNFVVNVDSGETRLQVIDGNARMSGQHVAYVGVPGKAAPAQSLDVAAGSEALVSHEGPVADASTRDDLLLPPPTVAPTATVTEGKLSDDPIMVAVTDGGDGPPSAGQDESMDDGGGGEGYYYALGALGIGGIAYAISSTSGGTGPNGVGTSGTNASP